MLYCIESMGMGRGYRDNDETFELFIKVLIDYVPFLNDTKELKVNDLHQEYFSALEEWYSYSKDVEDVQRQNEDKMADSLVFYKATGLIKLKAGAYYIDSKKLKEKFLEYQNYKEEKANIKTKGPRK